MSVQWGLWRFGEGCRHDGEALDALSGCLGQWGPDGHGAWSGSDGVTLAARAFHVTHEDLRQVQPYESPESGNVFTLDGRIDNREELMSALGLSQSRQTRIARGAWNPAAISSAPFPVLVALPKPAPESRIQPARWLVPCTGAPTDLELAAAAFDRWRGDCFKKLQGDWAMVAWEKQRQTLWLAKDVFGPRHLFYVRTGDFLCWSTRHECLSRVLQAGYLGPIALTADARYRAAGAMAMPAIDATPYNEIRAVPPAHALAVRKGHPIEKIQTATPPRPAPRKAVSFEQAAELFRVTLERSLFRRLRSAFPVTFELSGGCDSSTLVCLAHELRRRGKLSQDFYTTTRYPASAPHSQDRRHARMVEDHVGQRGRHVLVRAVADCDDVAAPAPEELAAFDEVSNARLEHAHSIAMRDLWAYRARYTDILQERGGRVLICGIGGDELAGGVQLAGTSLADEWTYYSVPGFCRSLQRWARYKNETVWRLMWQTAMEFLPLTIGSWLDGPSRRQAGAVHAHMGGVGKARLRMMKFAFSGSVRPWRSKRRQDEDVWPMSVVLSHKQRLCHIGCWHRAFPYVDADWVRLAALLPPVYIQTAFQRRRLLRATAHDAMPSAVLWRRTKDFGASTARSAPGITKRRLRDLEENAALLQVLQAASRSGLEASTESKSALESTPKKSASAARETVSGGAGFLVPAHVRFVSGGGGATLLDTARGKRIVLNPSGAVIWNGLADGKTADGIARELADRYGIALETARSDTRELLEELLRDGVIEVLSPEKDGRSEYVRA